ncbi:hypothetical protein ACTVZO_11085 [Streptomyces sp. IBSNAI002]
MSAAVAAADTRADPPPIRWAHESGMINARLGDLASAEEHLQA